MNERLNLFGMRNLPLIRQSEAAECGLACIAMIAWYHGLKTDLGELRRKYSISLRGAELVGLLDIAKRIDLGGRGIRCEPEELSQMRLPCMLHLNFNHFVVLKSVHRGKFVIHDPALGERALTTAEMDRAFTGVAVEFTPTEAFQPKAQPKQLSFFDLVRLDRSFLSPFSLGLLLALVAECMLLASPFFLQILIDEVLVKGDYALVWTLAIGFSGLLVFQAVSQLLRQLTLQFLGQIVSFDIAARLFSRMMRLTANFFTTRQLGDVQHRVMSLEAIRGFLTSGAVAMITDMFFVIVIGVVMTIYSRALFLVVLGVLVLYVLWRVSIFRNMKRAAGDLLVAEAAEQTHLLESLRSIQTIKTSGLESNREANWRNKMVRRANAHIRTGNLSIIEQNVTTLILDGGRLAILVFAALRVMDGAFSIGMLTAFAAYLGMLSGRMRTLVDSLIQFKLLQVPLQRIADIAFAQTEGQGEDGGRAVAMRGDVSLRRVIFRYGSSETTVLNGASFDVRAGEFVAIIGPSGAGKSTLLRILSGLETAAAGQVLFDGRPMTSWGNQTLRSQVGVVLQEDTLLQGSLAENIAGFDTEIDMERVREVAGIASIAADIEAMPMGYETLVGDMGSTLSGGQKQRVVLARAIYKRPRVLLLDEATSHLDMKNETAILDAVESLNMTRIVVAHRKETIEKANRVYRMTGGLLMEEKKLAEIRCELRARRDAAGPDPAA
ncbi:peptidase domain-containing ABC transporter [Maricaulis maris]|jgi:ATP-binding cassette, subfamily B, bacterial CvaB/MchF/RaxB|uniref:peptidase domain-containing ABC transporter n=1 Tax=Maricaulis maris TaxID=74318 RepID=UPI00292586AF|nr:colicin V biosynthesis protein [Maricaulis maris]